MLNICHKIASILNIVADVNFYLVRLIMSEYFLTMYRMEYTFRVAHEVTRHQHLVGNFHQQWYYHPRRSRAYYCIRLLTITALLV